MILNLDFSYRYVKRPQYSKFDLQLFICQLIVNIYFCNHHTKEPNQRVKYSKYLSAWIMRTLQYVFWFWCILKSFFYNNNNEYLWNASGDVHLLFFIFSFNGTNFSSMKFSVFQKRSFYGTYRFPHVQNKSIFAAIFLESMI